MSPRLYLPGVALSALLAAPGCEQNGREPVAYDKTVTPALASDDERVSLRVLENDELTPAIIDTAQDILEQHADQPLGHEVPFELEGRRYVGRLEQHYHPPGSEQGPDGEHVGVTVYVVER